MNPINSSSSSSRSAYLFELPPLEAVEQISRFTDLIEIASVSLSESDPVHTALMKLNALLLNAIDRGQANSLHAEKDILGAYAKIKAAVDDFVRSHGGKCGLGPLDELK